MYIHHHRGIIPPPPIPLGGGEGGGGNTGHGTIYFPYHFPIFSDMCLLFSLIFPIYFPYHFPILHRHPKVMGNFELRGQPFAGQVASLTVVTWMLRGLELVSEAKSDDFFGRGSFSLGISLGIEHILNIFHHIPRFQKISIVNGLD